MRGKAGLFSRFQPFSPALLSGLTAWIDASDASTLFDAQTGGSTPADNGDIFRVASKAGGWTWSTSSSTASLNRITSSRNGLDIARARSTSSPLKSSLLSGSDLGNFVTSSAYTVFVAASLSDGSSAQRSVLYTGSGQHGFFRPGSSQINALANGSSTASVGYTPNEWAVFTQRFSSNESELSIRRNGGTAGTASVSSLDFIATGTWDTRLPNSLNGDIGELIFYNVALSASDREAVESYLMNKWAIT